MAIIAVPAGSLTGTGTTLVVVRKIFPGVGSLISTGTVTTVVGARKTFPGVGSLALSGQLPSVNVYTTITGSIYDAVGTKLLSGRLYIKPSTFFRIGSNLIVPETTTYDIPGSGSISLQLAPCPVGVTYTIEFDPTPGDTTIPFRIKSGYFKDEWVVTTASTDIATL